MITDALHNQTVDWIFEKTTGTGQPRETRGGGRNESPKNIFSLQVYIGRMIASRFATYELSYQIAWTVKTEDDELADAERDRIATLLEEVADERELELLGKTVQPEYVHLIVNSPPRHSPKLLANWFKGLSATKYNRRYAEHEQKVRWSNEYFLATRVDDVERSEKALKDFLGRDDIEAHAER